MSARVLLGTIGMGIMLGSIAALTWFVIGPAWVWCIDQLAGALLADSGQ